MYTTEISINGSSVSTNSNVSRERVLHLLKEELNQIMKEFDNPSDKEWQNKSVIVIKFSEDTKQVQMR